MIDVVELRGGSAIPYGLDSSTCILHSYSIIPILTAVSILLLFSPFVSPNIFFCRHLLSAVCLPREM